jgi:hypothetical protein
MLWKVQEDFFGLQWWREAGWSRRRDEIALDLRGLLTLSSEFHQLALMGSTLTNTVAPPKAKWDGARLTRPLATYCAFDGV